MERISLEQVLAATGGAAVGFDRPDVGFDRVGLDSRRAGPGDLFWAVQGERHDGHDFASDALKRRAEACVVAAARAGHIPGPKIVVANTQQALGQFARWYRRSKCSLVVGITGSVGKTTTREMIHAVLSARFRGVRSPQNFNNHFGLPLSILEIEPQHEFAVLELGASQVGEIRELAEIAAPEVGVVTAVAEAHLGTFGSIDRITREKGELIASLPASGLAILAGDDPRVRGMAKRARCRTVLVGCGTESELRAIGIIETPNRIHFQVERDRYEMKAVGRHNVRAALCAIAVAREFGMRPEEIAEGLMTFTPAPGRCRLERIGFWWVIDDTYNASPGSLRAACDVLRSWAGSGKRVLVVGDMLELGPSSAELHYESGGTADEAGVDLLLGYGPESKELIRGARDAGLKSTRALHFEDMGELLAALEVHVAPEDVVLVKGSRGMRMERVVEWFRQRGDKLPACPPESSNEYRKYEAGSLLASARD